MKEKFISLLKAVGYFGLSIAFQVIVGVITMVVLMLTNAKLAATDTLGMEVLINDSINQYNGKINLIIAISAVMSILTIMFIYKIRKKSAIKEYGLKIVSGKNILVAISIAIAAWLIDSVVLTFMYKNNILINSFDSFAETSELLMNENIISLVFVVGILVPIAEEFVFRGAILRTLKKSISIKWAIFIQAILFGIAHGNMVQFIYTVFLGCILGYVTNKCKSLWPAIAIHMTNNIIATVASEPLDIVLQNNIIAIVILVLSVVGLIFAIKAINKNNIEEKVEELIVN